MMLIRADSKGVADTCLCLVDEGENALWIECSNPSCSSPWWHRKCANVSSFSEEEIAKLDFICPLCIISDQKFEKNLKVAKRQLEEVEMPHTSLPTSQTSPGSGKVANRQLEEVETSHTSLPTLPTSNTMNVSKILTADAKTTSSSNISTLPSNTETGNNTQTNSQQKITCKYYRRGVCRHGSSGKSLWNGMSCKFYHPKKCNKFCKYGYHPVMGCHDKNCKYLHPILCQNSIDEKRCLFPNCAFQHLHGTERPNRSHANPSYSFGVKRKSFSTTFHERPKRSLYPNSQRSSYIQPQDSFSGNRALSHTKNSPNLYFGKEEFPALSSSEEKINKISSSIAKIQECVDYLMRCNNASSQQFSQQQHLLQPFPNSNNSNTQASFYPQQSQLNVGLPVSRNEAKN